MTTFLKSRSSWKGLVGGLVTSILVSIGLLVALLFVLNKVNSTLLLGLVVLSVFYVTGCSINVAFVCYNMFHIPCQIKIISADWARTTGHPVVLKEIHIFNAL